MVKIAENIGFGFEKESRGERKGERQREVIISVLFVIPNMSEW